MNWQSHRRETLWKFKPQLEKFNQRLKQNTNEIFLKRAETRDCSELICALRICTRDLQIFSLTLSQLSYLGTKRPIEAWSRNFYQLKRDLNNWTRFWDLVVTWLCKCKMDDPGCVSLSLSVTQAKRKLNQRGKFIFSSPGLPVKSLKGKRAFLQFNVSETLNSLDYREIMDSVSEVGCLIPKLLLLNIRVRKGLYRTASSWPIFEFLFLNKFYV